MPRAKSEASTLVRVPKIDIQHMTLRLIGDSPLICHAWSEKAKRQMLEKQQGAARAAKERKDPHNDFMQSLYPIGDGKYGFPAVAFKSAAVDACTHVEGLTKVAARGSFHIDAEMVEITGSEPTMREDMVRIGMGTADIRYRGQFYPWSALLLIRFNAGALTGSQIAQLFDTAGFGVGVGEWRPQRDGSFGMFHVAREGDA